ncbi:MAG: SGNH/GDSL hydrolase family protein [Raineya sp.]
MVTKPPILKPLYRSILIGFYVITFGLIFLGLLNLKPAWKDKLFPKEPTTTQHTTTFTKKNISQIQERFGHTSSSDNTSKKTEKIKLATQNKKDAVAKKEEMSQIDSLQASIHIQYPNGNTKALQDFFKSLENLENNEQELYRVLHYGDSQLEGDRITSALRKKLQERFGGCGVGLLGATNYTNVKFSVLQESDSRWKNYFILGQKKADFGLYAYCFQLDSLAEILVKKSDKASPIQQKVENIKLLYKNSLHLIWQENNSTIQEKDLDAPSASVEVLPLSQNFEEAKLICRGNTSTEVYGLSLDCKRGVAVDNIPIRGSAGLEFRKMNSNNLQKQTKDLNVKLVILQFGVNVTMNTQNYSFYENKLVEEILFLKKCIPNASFLLVGSSDRSYKTPNGYASYPAVEWLRDTQKRVAARTNCAFWDLYEAMGGRNSMPIWVAEDLAAKDFIHFKPKGADLVGNMLAEALLLEYNKFRGFSP